MTLTLQIRPVTPADAERLVDLVARCSDDARYFRFHAAKPRLRAAEAAYLAAVDGRSRVALAATAVENGEERIVADARFDVIGDGDAEAALLLRDDVTNRGLGTLLLDRLLEMAAGLGLRRLLLDILPENRAMLALARRVGAQAIGFDGRSVLYAVSVTR
ncbi:MAG: GNAT family N-acetyltransferase [Actinomycetota bacterium]